MLLVAVSALFGVHAAASAPPQTQSRFSSRTLGVRVDVLVTEGNHPVGGLTAADFELRDNGVAQSRRLRRRAGGFAVGLRIPGSKPPATCPTIGSPLPSARPSTSPCPTA